MPLLETKFAPLSAPVPEEEAGFFDHLIAAHDTGLNHGYEEALKQPQEKEAVILSLEDIPEEVREKRIKQLGLKLEEYTQRLREEWNIHDWLDNLTTYKRDVLRLLLAKSEINTWALSLAYVALYDNISSEFLTACAVIHDYLETGGAEAKGGTGLPQIK